ncbi:MAG: hypothetical protein HOP17_16090 [Acidobacteria bacterium]|nr:hypothetical protein [Acidobacteriota bacterium]
MKNWTVNLIAFLCTLGVGMFTGTTFLQPSAPINGHDENRVDVAATQPVSPMPSVVSRKMVGISTPVAAPTPEFANVRVPREFENGDFRSLVPVFRDAGGASLGKCEITKETARPWLGLFKRGSTYSLETVDVKFERPQTDDFGVFIPMRFRDSQKALFLFGHDDRIKPGTVKTLHEMPYGGDEESLIGDGFRKDFDIGGRTYTLRVGSGISETNSPVLVAVLEAEGKRDMLYFRPDHTGNIGRFEWVGDLDNDERLDLLFSFFAVNGGGKNYILFLSSIASSDHLVQPYAFFETQFRGC